MNTYSLNYTFHEYTKPITVVDQSNTKFQRIQVEVYKPVINIKTNIYFPKINQLKYDN